MKSVMKLAAIGVALGFQAVAAFTMHPVMNKDLNQHMPLLLSNLRPGTYYTHGTIQAVEGSGDDLKSTIRLANSKITVGCIGPLASRRGNDFFVRLKYDGNTATCNYLTRRQYAEALRHTK